MLDRYVLLVTLGVCDLAYTFRRLSSGLGLAAGADERQLCTELPRNAMGFQSPIALAINVRIARVTDDIMSSEPPRYTHQTLDSVLIDSHQLYMVISQSPNWN